MFKTARNRAISAFSLLIAPPLPGVLAPFAPQTSNARPGFAAPRFSARRCFSVFCGCFLPELLRFLQSLHQLCLCCRRRAWPLPAAGGSCRPALGARWRARLQLYREPFVATRAELRALRFSARRGRGRLRERPFACRDSPERGPDRFELSPGKARVRPSLARRGSGWAPRSCRTACLRAIRAARSWRRRDPRSHRRGRDRSTISSITKRNHRRATVDLGATGWTCVVITLHDHSSLWPSRAGHLLASVVVRRL